MSVKRPDRNTAAHGAAAGHREADPRSPAGFVGGFLEGYVAWREHCIEVTAAYTRWRDASRADRAAAFVSYCAALDREACAARTHEVGVSWLTRATRMVGGAR